MNISNTVFCHDASFGPTVYSKDCHRVDFSLLFEDAIFAILPTTFFLLVSPIRFIQLYRRAPKARCSSTTRHLTKSVCEISPSLDFASAVAVGLLSYCEQVKSARPAPLITTFLSLTSLLDGARTRTEWLISGSSSTIPSIFSASLATKVLLLLLESLSKGHDLLQPLNRNYTTEETAGIFSLSCFAWIIPLVIKGYRHHLSIDDLYPVNHDIAAATVAAQLKNAWQSSKKNKSYSLFLATARALWVPLCLPMIPQFFLVAFNLMQPLLINNAVDFVENPRDKPAVFGYGLIGAMGLTYLGIAIATAWYQYLTAKTLAKIRAALIGLTYQSMLEMNQSVDSMISSSVVSLINVDVDRIINALQWVIGIAPDAIQVGLAVWLLQIHLGAICVAPVLVVLGHIRSCIWSNWQTRPAQATIVDAGNRDQNGGDIGSAGFNEGKEELRISKRFRQVQISNIIVGNSPRLLSPIITFIAFGIVVKTSGNKTPDTATIFSALSLLSILIDPVNELVAIGPNLAMALDCFNRIQEYVTQEKRVDYRDFSCYRDDNNSTDANPAPKRKNEIGAKGAAALSTLEEEPTAGTEIQLINVDVGWARKTLTLQNLSLTIDPLSLNIVIGDVGSGKSTFLKLLLGEVMILKGSVRLGTDEIAYCDQTAFVRNQSIRENIVGPLNYDSEWYSTCIKACALDVDIQTMPQMDSTVVGSKGIALSGGQKQRITLARAAYARKKIILLDDVLAGLDAITERHCFHNLLGENGIFRRHTATVIYVTHSVKWLPYADKIIALGPKGNLQQMGTYQELVSKAGYVQDLKLKTSDHVPESEISLTKDQIDQHEFRQEQTDKAVGLVNETEDQDQNNSIRSNPSSILFYIGSMGWIRFLSFVLLVGVEVATNAMQSIWLSWWTDANQKHPNSNLGRWMGVYAAFGLLSLCFLGMSGAYLLILIIPKSSNRLHWNVLRCTMMAPITFFSKKNTGSILNLFSQDMTLIDMQLPIALILATGSFGNSISGVVLTSVATSYMAISIPFLVITLCCLQRVYLQTSRQIRALDLEAKSPLLEHFLESLEGSMSIHAFSWTHHLISENFHRLDQSQKPFYLLLCIQRWLGFVLNCIIVILAIVLMAVTVALRDRINPGLLGVAMVSVVNLGQTLSSFITYWTTLETSLTAISRIKRYINETPSEELKQLPQDWPSELSIEFQHVSVSFHPTGKSVLTDINLSIPSGQCIAICGRSGSGKSTLIACLAGLLRPNQGCIRIGQHVISNSSQQEICQRLITAITQEAWFMPRGCDDTVRDNLDPFGQVQNDEEIYRVLEKTGLREQIDRMGGLQARLKQDGDGMLSMGQTQLFCLARAMLSRRSGKILIMDEAMSSVDYKTETTILSLLRTEFAGWTIIAIVHRLRFIPKYFDRVLVLHQGRVVECDTPQCLLADSSSFLRKMTEGEQLEHGGQE
ncbi:putative multidrug resistance protein [Talaromyces proteolyticus]|uniref:Multidrug resistance protein n=1 Tax=Talaromyces proteolyticus TaxID=1131652 RepID=A0AAD4Q2L4_9EURO|nr:putative multidrug resistance protein [Talaromyces proteolyticus]KAH8700537.1 putative multidrug resistance protein [Talaromyces proteolyticus]